MKSKLLILLFVVMSFQSRAQLTAVPNTDTFTLQDVYDVITYWADFYGNYPTADLSSCFTQANLLSPSFFDPAYNNDSYAPANSLKRFRNYQGTGACTRPSGLYTATFYNQVDGVAITSEALAIYYMNNFSCNSVCGSIDSQLAGFTDGNDVYRNPLETNCTKTPDGYYVMSYLGTKYPVQIISGKLYNIAI